MDVEDIMARVFTDVIVGIVMVGATVLAIIRAIHLCREAIKDLRNQGDK